jgi:protein SFI1
MRYLDGLSLINVNVKSLPAVRFHASHVKAKAWKKWRDAMPGALQAKAARDLHKENVMSEQSFTGVAKCIYSSNLSLGKAFDKWLQVYRTKVALKAVAYVIFAQSCHLTIDALCSRARFLRLPTAAPRITPRAAAARSPPQEVRLAPRRRSFRSPSPEPETDSASEPIPPKSTLIPRPNYMSRSSRREAASSTTSRLQPARAPSPAHSSISAALVARNSSPTRPERPPSSSGGEAGRSRLWIELQEMQRRSRTPTTGRLSPFSPRRDPL